MRLPAVIPDVRRFEPSGDAPVAIGALSLVGDTHSWVAEAAAARLPLVSGGLPLTIAFDTAIEAEGYRLSVAPAGVALSGGDRSGVRYGLSTLAQLCHSNEVPAGVIDDGPEFTWRGLLLDPARRFLPLPVLLETLDAMALTRLNTLHLHLSDDQGFRLALETFPELASSDGAYSRSDIAHLCAEAGDRGITIVPEIDVPGHVRGLLAARPDWGMTPGDQQRTPARRFGVHPDCLNVADPRVRADITALFAEVAEWFPGPWLHIGGDEVSTEAWSLSEQVQALIAQQGLESVRAVQPWYTAELVRSLAPLGKRIVVWDEALADSLPADVVVQAWRGVTPRDRARLAGHDTVLSGPYYLDLHYPIDAHAVFAPDAPEAELIEQEDALLLDDRFAHIADGMAWTAPWRKPNQGADASDSAVGALLGGEACLWGELVDAEHLHVRAWSRLPAIADRLWSNRDRPRAELRTRQRRVQALLARTTSIDLSAIVDRQLAELGLSEDARAIACLLEPVKWYGRLLGEEALRARLSGTEMPQARPYTVESPLNQLADVLPPESQAAWRFADLVDRFVESSGNDRDELTRDLERWQRLTVLGVSPGNADVDPFVENLELLSASLLKGLKGSAIDLDIVERAARPQGELLLAVAFDATRLAGYLTATDSGTP